jgi:hypothetical protein
MSKSETESSSESWSKETSTSTAHEWSLSVSVGVSGPWAEVGVEAGYGGSTESSTTETRGTEKSNEKSKASEFSITVPPRTQMKVFVT